MSMESAEAFYERVEKDAELRKVLSERNPEMTDVDLEAVSGGAHYPIFD